MKVRQNAGWMASILVVQSAVTAFAAHQVSLPVDLAAAGTQVVNVKIGLSYSEGPAVDPDGNLYFSEDPDINAGRIWKITPSGQESVYKEPSRGSNGLDFDKEGRLHIAMLDSVLRVEKDGKVTVLASKGTNTLSRVNDLSVSSTGSLFFTNLGGNTVFFRGTDGVIKTRNFNSVNGIEWIEEKSIVYIASGGLQKCKVTNSTGEIGTCTNFSGGADGLTTDANGNVWRAAWGEGRIYAHDSTGKQLGYIFIDSPIPPGGKNYSPGVGGNASNCHFGGPDGKTLWITGDGGLYKIQLKVAGRQIPQWPTTTAVRDYRFSKPVARTGASLLWKEGRLLLVDSRFGKAGANGRLLP